ncbi:hypothetical protein ACHAQA_008491 [Verticillium albo-atrum]
MTKPEPSSRTEAPTEEEDAPAEEKEAAEQKARILQRPLVVSVGEFDFEDFKNRWGEEATYHVIELLTGSENTPDEFTKVKTQRNRTGRKRWKRQERKSKSTMKKALEGIEKRVADEEPSGAEVELKDDDMDDGTRPLHSHGERRASVAAKEDRPKQPKQRSLGDAGHGTRHISFNSDLPSRRSSQGVRWNDGTYDADHEAEADNADVVSGKVALAHMRCYVNFMEQRVLPLENMFAGTNRHLVRFDDLWYLFKLGDIVYSPVGTAARDVNRANNTETSRRRYQTSFIIYFKGVSVVDDTEPDDFRAKDRTMVLWCYYLDHNGESYGPVKERIVIEVYTGQKDIRELAVFPLRFANNVDKLRAELDSQGKRFRDFVKLKHVSCEGWTLTGSPLGTDDKEEETPDHIESDVIIDFGEALRRQPSWKPAFEAPILTEAGDDWRQGVDAMHIMHWPSTSTPGKRDEPWFTIEECTQRDDGTEELIKRSWTESNTFLKTFGNGVVKTLDGIDEETNNLLLPRRFFVYVLRQRRFAMVDTISLSVVPPQSTIFEDLRIDSNHKLIVQSLVADHFEKRRVQRQQPILGSMNQDLVRGKGSGLFILLHGVPGVGKTATAEAVAQANKKPLFTITCGDLGLTPEAVDSKLNEVFRLAHLWDCVLLMDEADIFLARRDSFNLKRNALVSVFLRVLEYYSGILFLTTNRVGILDEAFKSRIHISLYYEPLSRIQTVEIFRVNIKKLRAMEDEKQERHKGTDVERPRLLIKAKSIVDYAQRYFDEQEETPHLRWNGRQIRNAFQIASSLAHYHIRKDSMGEVNLDSGQVACPVLDEVQFDKVAEAIERFGNYMDHTRAMTDADQARLDAVRADEMRNHDLAPRKRGYSTFGAPVVPAPGQERRATGGQRQTRRAADPSNLSPGSFGNTRVQGRERSNIQGPSARNPPPTRRGGSNTGTRHMGSQRRAQDQYSASSSRSYPEEVRPGRGERQAAFDEPYDEEEDLEDGYYKERDFYSSRQEEPFEEDVDDSDEGLPQKGERGQRNEGGEDYDDE